MTIPASAYYPVMMPDSPSPDRPSSPSGAAPEPAESARPASQPLQIVFYPHPALRTVGQPIEQINDHVRQVAARMIELMHEARGVGLAATQVGLAWRLFVANPQNLPDGDLVFINPVLSEPDRESIEHEEGCLSLPHITGQIVRPKAVTIEATDLQGRPFRIRSDELGARVWQHEVDHLDAVLIIDRMAPIDKMASRAALKDLEDNFAAS